jgi:pyruvate/2-oxoacid:ferredoxin oxidoreductase beta subunit/Pyruvate/2-oxoacid:ferredoxin oxidoreductase gamma subunit
MNAPAYATYLTDAIGPLPFCPGCGHDLLVKALDKALVKLQPDPKKVVIVTDIGCIGLADRYFVTNGFHGLHGRSITYACGLKLARPELTVIALKGDGGCGIGGAHFLNVARRNIGITLIVANNFNYGMTGGQHSVTTPTEGITATTPWGNVEGALDLCAIAIAAGAPWAYRGTSYDKDLPDRIAEAIERPDFAMLDIWELCTAYYLPRNELKKKDLFELFETCGMDAGLLRNTPRPEYGARTRAIYGDGRAPLKKRRVIEPKYPNTLDRQTGIVIAGSAGQKIRSSATTFAQGAMFADLKATQKDDYPITVMTGHSSTEIIVSPEPVDYTAIETPDCVVVLSGDGLKKAAAVIAKLPPTSTIYMDESLAVPQTAARVVPLPLIRAAKEIDRLSIAIVALAAVLRDQGLFPLDALKESISAFQAPDVAAVNLKAVDAGSALTAGDA